MNTIISKLIFSVKCSELILERSHVYKGGIYSEITTIKMKALQFGASNIDRYVKKGKVGGGAYGVVHKALDTRTGDTVAIKKIKLEVQTEGVPSTALREITILRTMENQNVVK